jgi:hypothetical protein
LSPHPTSDEPICVNTESGDTVGFVSEDNARALLKLCKATYTGNPNKRFRAVTLVASEAEPLRGKSRAVAAAGYTGHEKYTYDEALLAAGGSRSSLARLPRPSPELACRSCMQQASDRKAAGDSAGAVSLMRQAKQLKEEITKLSSGGGAVPAAPPATAAASC